MNNEQRQKLEEDILNKRVVDYGGYRIIYNIATGEISIYEKYECVIKKGNIKEVIDFFQSRDSNRKKLHREQQPTDRHSDRCRERNKNLY